jgi:lipoprotein-anchoring transpeptidase ErfK/SrfK
MISRRVFLAVAAGAPLAGCQTARQNVAAADDDMAGWYIGQMEDQPHPIPLVDRSKIKAEYARMTVDYDGGQAPGTIVVDIDQRMLYLAQGGGKAIRYGVGVGKQGFLLARHRPGGPQGRVARLDADRHHGQPQARPAPPPQGRPRQPARRALALSLPGQPRHPVRIHGTNEPWSIGEQVSSGCVRMLNEDIFDLYNRVPVGTTVLVRRNGRWRV